MFPIKDSIPSNRFPIINWFLIALNIYLFFVEVSLGFGLETFILKFGLVPKRYFILDGSNPTEAIAKYLPFLTSMFLHGGWFHLLGNMLFLYIFGDNVEDRLGHIKYLFFYILCGIIAGYTHILTNPYSVVPTIGASGAIAGVLGAYMVLFPHSRIYTLFFIFIFVEIVQVPAFVYLFFWFIIQLFSGLGSLGMTTPTEGGVAWFAHIGGFIPGAFIGIILRIIGRKRPRYYDRYRPW